MSDSPQLSQTSVDLLLSCMEDWRASDLFLCEETPPSARIDGDVRRIQHPVTTRAEMHGFVDTVMSPQTRARFEESGDADVGYTAANGKRFRFNFSRTKGRIALVARALPNGDLLLKDLGLPPAIGELADAKRGLVLITGATGSGKSTTLAGIVHRINSTQEVHIVTLEDPIEFVHADIRARVTQRELGSDTASFPDALRTVVRQSPDVILVGEMRDQNSMQIALSAALTGHLVFATLHTVNATQTLQRILSYFPSHQRAQAALDLSMSLKGVVSQRLIPRADQEGRVLAVEMLGMSPGVRRLIREQRVEDLEDLMRHRNDPNTVTFNQSLLALYTKGAISLDVGQAYASNPDEFRLATQGMATGAGTFAVAARGDATGFDMKALLRLALDRGASDLHLTVGRPPIFRVSGELQTLESEPLTDADLRVLLFSVLTSSQRSKFELDRELDFAVSLDSRHRFRVNTYFQKGKMAAALRSIPSRIPSPQELGLPEVVIRLGKRSQGLLLVVGPTGSGKSTTLACLIDQINKTKKCRILTIEDPIEFTHEQKLATVDQREVHSDTNSFSAALKFILRQDPDVILVGEMRDAETIHAAITAAETGHLVLATLHTNDATQAIDRIIDVFPSEAQSQIRTQLAAALLGVVSQRLLPHSSGTGRVAAFEIMIANSAIRNVIRSNKMHQAISVMETSLADGMLTMDRSLQALCHAGHITQQDAHRLMLNPATLLGGTR